MPNAISNHFCITAIQEGVTIQGSLRISGTLSQNFNANTGKAIPNWKATTDDPNPDQPIVYLVARRGVSYVTAAGINNGQWLYNDVVIEFDAQGKSTNFKDADNAPLFQKGTTTANLGGTTYSVPCLTVISNLASATNVDLDTIGFKGSVEVAGKQMAFHCQVDVKIAQMTSQGFLGLLSPESAIISSQDQSVTIKASLYAEDGQSPASWFCKWFNAGTGDEYVTLRNARQASFMGADFVDNLMVRCDFYTDAGFNNRVATAFSSIDDTQDPEYLYISMNANNADFSGQLAPGETCTVTMWVATMEDSTNINTQYTSFVLHLYDGDQNEITSGVPSVSVNDNKGTAQFPYDLVARCGYKVFGIVTAS